MSDAEHAEHIHRQLAAPGHKASDALRCECGHRAADRRALNWHQLLPGGRP